MSKRYKGAGQEPSLIDRLRGPHDAGWQPKQYPPPPAIQLEAADALYRLDALVTLHNQFLVSKQLLPEFSRWAEGALRKLGG